RVGDWITGALFVKCICVRAVGVFRGGEGLFFAGEGGGGRRARGRRGRARAQCHRSQHQCRHPGHRRSGEVHPLTVTRSRGIPPELSTEKTRLVLWYSEVSLVACPRAPGCSSNRNPFASSVRSRMREHRGGPSIHPQGQPTT